jgi:hypothetical protein
MARRRLNPERVLSPSERWRRHRLRKRGIEPPPAPRRLTAADHFEAMFPGYSVPTLDEIFAAASEARASVEDAA